MNKRNIVLSVILGSILIAGVFSATYAYFAINQSNTSSNVTIVTGNTTLVLDDADPITREDKISPNNTSITRYLTIRNEGSVDGYAKLLFKNLVNTFVLDDLTYTLEEVNSDKSSLATPNIIVDKEVVPKSSVASNTKLADGLLISANTSKYYKLTVSYDYKTDTNQDADLNKILTSGFIIEEGSKPISNIYCVNESGTEINCSNALSQGQRIAIGRDENVQYFRYIRTTNTSSSATYNECSDGDSASIACTDSDERNPLSNNKIRVLSEHNLKRTGTASSNTAIAENALQDINEPIHILGTTLQNGVNFSNSDNKYSISYVKVYNENYANYLNTTYFDGNSILTSNSITVEELETLGCDRTLKTCSEAPEWIRNAYFWSSSPEDPGNDLWCPQSNVLYDCSWVSSNNGGVRPVIMFDADLLK